MESFMDDALKLAYIANQQKEVPVGCIFIYKNKIIATGANLVNETKNATQHAEIICIDKVIEYCQRNNDELSVENVFPNLSVVVTVEPCIMCSAALIEIGVKEIIYGCANDRFGGVTVVNIFELLKSKIDVRGGVRGDEAMALLKEFYKGENPSAPIPKKRN